MTPSKAGRGECGAPIIIQMTRATQSADSAHHFTSAISETHVVRSPSLLVPDSTQYALT